MPNDGDGDLELRPEDTPNDGARFAHSHRKRLVQVSDCARIRGLTPDTVVIVGGHKDDRIFDAAFRQLKCQFYASHLLEIDIDDKTTSSAGRCDFKECFS